MGVQVQLVRLAIEHGHAARQHGQGAGTAVQLAVRLAQGHHFALAHAFRIGLIRPHAHVGLAHQQALGAIVGAAMLGVRRQSQFAYQASLFTLHHPLFRLPILADQEQMVELLGVTVQAGRFHGKGGHRERRQAIELTGLHVDGDGQRALRVRFQEDGQHFAAIDARVELLGAHGDAVLLLAAGVEQAQAVLVQGQPAAAGQARQFLGLLREGRQSVGGGGEDGTGGAEGGQQGAAEYVFFHVS
ncbi:hypothetical protein D3C85_530720 [compost metagenome]